MSAEDTTLNVYLRGLGIGEEAEKEAKDETAGPVTWVFHVMTPEAGPAVVTALKQLGIDGEKDTVANLVLLNPTELDLLLPMPRAKEGACAAVWLINRGRAIHSLAALDPPHWCSRARGAARAKCT